MFLNCFSFTDCPKQCEEDPKSGEQEVLQIRYLTNTASQWSVSNDLRGNQMDFSWHPGIWSLEYEVAHQAKPKMATCNL